MGKLDTYHRKHRISEQMRARMSRALTKRMPPSMRGRKSNSASFSMRDLAAYMRMRMTFILECLRREETARRMSITSHPPENPLDIDHILQSPDWDALFEHKITNRQLRQSCYGLFSDGHYDKALDAAWEIYSDTILGCGQPPHNIKDSISDPHDAFVGIMAINHMLEEGNCHT